MELTYQLNVVDAQIEMEHNSSQTAHQEAGLKAVVSGSSAVGSIQNDGAAAAAIVVAGDTSGGSAASSVSATANGGATGGTSAAAPTGGGGALAAAGSDVGAAAGPSKKRRSQCYTEQQINVLETYYKEDTHPNQLKRNEIAQALGMEPNQIRYWFQNKRSQVKNQSTREKNETFQSENDNLRAQIQYFTEVLSNKNCQECGWAEENILRSENIRLREEVRQLKSTVARNMAGEDLQNLPIAFQDSQNPSTSQDPPNFSIVTSQNPQDLALHVQSPQDLHIVSEADNASTSNTSSGDRLNTVNLLTSDEFRHSITKLVISAADELKQMAMAMQPLWICRGAEGATSILNQSEYLATFPNYNSCPTRFGYTCEASRHIARILQSPAQLLNILMNVNEWALMFSAIVSRALTLGVLNDGVDHIKALQVVDAEYHIPTPLIPKREICFARYCTQHSEGVWAVVDVSLDNILPTLENITCQKKPSGCVIQAMDDGTSKITWIEHVYVDYNGVSTMYKPLILSGLGYGAKRWVSILERQGQRLATAMSSNVPSTRDFNNLLTSSTEGKRRILKVAERMANNFFFGITGPKGGRWTKLNWNFGDDVRLMSTRVMDDPGIRNSTLLSVSTSFVLSNSPKMVFDFLRDHSFRKKWDAYANGDDYEPLFNISYGEGAGNLVSVYKVPTRRQEHLQVLQESWSDAVASHIVFSTTETGSIDVVLGGGNPNSLPLLPSGFTILPGGPSFGEEGTSKTLLTVSFQLMFNRSPVVNITHVDAAKVVKFLRCSCKKIKHALNAVDPNA
ncbi:homeobox-leucine zipper protein PROTODERMAL FACTOR 2-like [Apium graveolens]|uniref:homeobox-leucine zipper protein PROTODERMAL FACTOR 2-like n=1 Tax=Apium graveolens TaxID=4045 RepID=UPI003D796A30